MACFMSRKDPRRVQNGNILRFRNIQKKLLPMTLTDLVLTLRETNRDAFGRNQKTNTLNSNPFVRIVQSWDFGFS